MQAVLSVDSRGFSRALEEMSRTTGLALRKIIIAEAGSILKACAGDTKVATEKTVTQKAINRTLGKTGLGLTKANDPGDISINTGARGTFGRVWVRSPAQRRGSGKPFRLAGTIGERTLSFSPERYHWRRPAWTDITEAVADAAYQLAKVIPAAKKSIGLARQSWVQIADSLGIRLESVPGGRISASAIAKARAAIASTGRPYTNGLGRRHDEAQSFFVTLVNRLPYGTRIGLDRILAKNINGRVRYFHENMRRGVFDHLSTIARKYPGLDIRNN